MIITLDISDSKVAQQVLWLLDHFKKDGVKISSTLNLAEPEEIYTDEYIEEHWMEFVMTKNDDSDYYKSEQYYSDRAESLEEKSR